MKYLHYPGCSLKGSGRAYEESLLAVYEALGVSVEELDDWNCCGATAYMAVDELKAFALAARNLALAEGQHAGQNGDDGGACLVAPCSACFLVLSKAKRYMEEYGEVGRRINEALAAAGLPYQGRIAIRHPLDLFINDVGLPAIAARVRRPLHGLRVACYYGCQLVRPYATFDDQFDPQTMDRLLRALGAETVDWPLKTRCCSGSLTGTIPDVGLHLNHILLKEARRHGANVVATACPLCQFNLECFQDRMSRRYGREIHTPVLYFTQLMGVALGLPDKTLGLQRLFVPLNKDQIQPEGVQHVGV
ncbi:MAG TPA: CoB--CoM heterodisulfide reductase iron-sulfur subunit B family protein [Acidobacteriota bacterium]|nr:CoB--CoM heterodisulfide reductase iron-sulfur subunit B family protein [Acidobacteriota bacterium]